MKPPPPVKSRGQHFLKDARVVRKIVELLRPESGDTVVEIGPGRGALTKGLMDTGQPVVAVEPDPRMVEFLQSQFHEKLAIVHESILEVRAKDLVGKPGQAVLAGNLPYNLSGPILEWIFLSARYWRRVVVMLQLEVARRLVAQPATREFGPLAVARALHFDAGRKFLVHPGAFFPIPAVTSAVVELIPTTAPPVVVQDRDHFLRFVHALFAHRRKNLRNNLLAAGEIPEQLEEALKSSGVDGRLRAEQLRWEQLATLYDSCMAESGGRHGQ